MTEPNDRTTHFGYETVAEDEKAGRVHGVFTSVASKYDVMNDAMSLGIHRVWKDALLDWIESMLIEGRKRSEDEGHHDKLDWIVGDAMALPLPSNSFDAYTISFGIRNVTRIEDAIAEAYRVLRPGGRFMVLEFSRVPHAGLRKLYDLYSFNVIPRMGQVIAGDRDSYQYLVESIRKFPSQEIFASMIREAGFQNVSYRNLTLGVAAIHSGWKI